MAQAYRGYVAGVDDLRACQMAEAIGLKVTGALGILPGAKQADRLPVVKPLVDYVTAQGFCLSPELHRDVLDWTGETP